MPLATLQERSQGQCELCTGTENLSVYDVPPAAPGPSDPEIYICELCLRQIEKKEPMDGAHWQCLTGSMWSEVPAVQVVAWRMLHRLKTESWAADNLEILYLDDNLLGWAKATGDHDAPASVEFHQDSNGKLLQDGDTVVLTRSLDVKGSTLNARMGTVVKNIRLVPNNTDQIEGRIEGQLIVILTKFVRKQGA
ncbi:MAG: PhnA domain-containing protein [Vulcanimicrobiota bacterium]